MQIAPQRAPDARDPQPVSEEARLERAGEAELAEHHEHQHVARHRHREHERPVEPAATREVVERHEEREPAADHERADADADREQRAVAERAGSSVLAIWSNALPSPRKLAGSASSGPTMTHRDDPAEHGPPRDAFSLARGGTGGADSTAVSVTVRANPLRASTRSRRRGAGPPRSTSMGSVFTVAQSLMCLVGGPPGSRRTHRAATICSWALGEVRYSRSAIAPFL